MLWVYNHILSHKFTFDGHGRGQGGSRNVHYVITDKDGKKLSKKDNIPPEAVIYASRNSPKNGWFVPLLSTLIGLVSSVVTLIAAFMELKQRTAS